MAKSKIKKGFILDGGRVLSNYNDNYHCSGTVTFAKTFNKTPLISVATNAGEYNAAIDFNSASNNGFSYNVYSPFGQFSSSDRAWVYWMAISEE